MRSVFSILLLSFLCVYTVSGQDILKSCPDIKNGTFYSYPPNSNDNWITIRDGDYQKDINLTTGDTTVYKIKWNKSCSFTLNYHSGGNKLSPEVLQLIKKYNWVYTITESTSEFHIGNLFVESSKNAPISRDTLWNKPRNVQANRLLFVALSQAEQQKVKLKDTSQYALVYLYRPAKFVCGGVGFPIYANGILMAGFPAHGGAAYVFKIFRPGRLRLQGEAGETNDPLDVDIQFGKKYYVRLNTKHKITNCKPFLVEMDKIQGETEFLEIK